MWDRRDYAVEAIATCQFSPSWHVRKGPSSDAMRWDHQKSALAEEAVVVEAGLPFIFQRKGEKKRDKMNQILPPKREEQEKDCVTLFFVAVVISQNETKQNETKPEEL